MIQYGPDLFTHDVGVMNECMQCARVCQRLCVKYGSVIVCTCGTTTASLFLIFVAENNESDEATVSLLV